MSTAYATENEAGTALQAEQPQAEQPQAEAQSDMRRTLAQRLREETVGLRLRLTNFGATRKITADQRQQAASLFHAAEQYLSASKKLLDTRHPKYLAVTKVLGEARWYWHWQTIEYPQPGIRLIRRDKLDEFDATMRSYQQALHAAVLALDDAYADMLEQAKSKLGDLYNQTDYPERLGGSWSIDWEVRSVDPPDYLKQLNPRLWEQERAKAEARLMEGVLLAEQAFTTQLHDLVSRLAERLQPGADGKKKIFRDTAIENMTDFIARFRAMNVNSSEELDAVVRQAEDAIRGTTPAELRTNEELRARLAEQMATIATSLDAMVIEAPDREIELEDES